MVPHITALRIEQHNETVNLIARALAKSTDPNTANAHLLVDAVRDSRALPAYIGDRVPEWMLPQLTPVERKKLRPDILIVRYDASLLDRSDPEWVREIRSIATLQAVEIGFGGDTRFEETLARKENQHTTLTRELRAQGWRSLPTTHLIFGMGGSNFKHTQDALRDELSLPTDVTHDILRRTQRRAAARAHQTVTTRRILERQIPSAPTNGLPRWRHRWRR